MTTLETLSKLDIDITVNRKEVTAAYDEQVEIAKAKGARETIKAANADGSYNSEISKILWELRGAKDVVFMWISDIEENLQDEHENDGVEKDIADLNDFQRNF